MDTSSKLILLALLVLCAVAAAPSSAPLPRDENIYFLMGREVLRGSVPYRDFFFAHPPVMLYVLAGSFMVLGSSWWAGSLVATVVNVGLLLGCFHAARRSFGERGALLATALLLSSRGLFEVGQTDGNALSLLFCVLALERHLAGRPFSAGMLCGTAVLTKLFAVVAAPAILADLYLSSARRRDAKVFVLGIAVVVLPVSLALAAIAGPQSVLDSVVRFHLQKEPFTFGVRAAVISVFLRSNALAMVAGTAALWMLPKRPRSVVAFLLLATVFVLVQRRLVYPYMVYPLLACAVLGGGLLDRIVAWGGALRVLVAVALVASIAWSLVGYHLATQGQSEYSSAVLDIANKVRESTGPDERISGHSTAVTAVAFLADRRMSGGVMDTNYERIASGVLSGEELVRTVDADRPSYLVLKASRIPTEGRPRYSFAGIALDEDFRQFALDRYVGVLERPIGRYDVLLLLGRSGGPDPSKPGPQ